MRLALRAALPFALVALAVLACGEDRERLDVPRLYLELDQTEIAPGDTVRGRIAGADDFGGVVRLAVRLCIDSGFDAAFLRGIREDSVGFRFRLPVPASTPENALVIVEAQVNDDQNFFVSLQDTIVARTPDTPPGPSPLEPSCARP